jgi:hypothetical protein
MNPIVDPYAYGEFDPEGVPETALPPVRSEPMLADDLEVADCAVTLKEARGVIRRLTRRVREQQDRLNNQAAWIAELKANSPICVTPPAKTPLDAPAKT